MGWLFVHGIRAVERLFKSLPLVPAVMRPALGGLLVGGIALALRPVVEGPGVAFSGYALVESTLSGALELKVLTLLIVAKVLATAVTAGSGGAGGLFAPALSLGAVLGAAVGMGAVSAAIPRKACKEAIGATHEADSSPGLEAVKRGR